ncbi:MAG: cob(I)yrinic acid a,c-diamide adenosyltransferase [Myxococcota bacterium]
MKIYTRTGDAGETGLFGGARVSKAHVRVSSYGDVDELNSQLGVARAALGEGNDDLRKSFLRVQSELFDLGAELATAPEKAGQAPAPRIDAEAIAELEGEIDRADEELPALTSFILPGGTSLAAHLHVARTVCRRAERSVIALREEQEVRDALVHYLNRLSDALFTWARLANHRAGVADPEWVGRERVAAK